MGALCLVFSDAKRQVFRIDTVFVGSDRNIEFDVFFQCPLPSLTYVVSDFRKLVGGKEKGARHLCKYILVGQIEPSLIALNYFVGQWVFVKPLPHQIAVGFKQCQAQSKIVFVITLELAEKNQRLLKIKGGKWLNPSVFALVGVFFKRQYLDQSRCGQHCKKCKDKNDMNSFFCH